MSELINKLALQAFEPINAISSEGVADWYTFNHTWFQLYTKRFAELIVQECVKSVQETPAGYQDYRSQIEEAMRDYCASSIKEHFGVEE